MENRSPRLYLLLGAAFLGAAVPADAAPPAADETYSLVEQLTVVQTGKRREAAKKLLAAPDPTLLPALTDALFFTPKLARGEVLTVLRGLAGEDAGDGYYDWVEYVGRRTDLTGRPGYLEHKASMLSRIDPAYRKILYPGAPVRIRLEEVVSGGVKLEGIPALEDPPRVPAGKARFLDKDEPVFGVSVGGAHHAYPHRYLSWHEMVNDIVGGEPITLSYCTLCNSGIVYSGKTPEGYRRTFGTSGLLYRSNKLMVDRQTATLWSNLTGEPVAGRLAARPVPLVSLPVTVTTWGEWMAAHPDTTVTRLDNAYGLRWGFEYRPGAADRARTGVSFPVWQKSQALDPKTEVFALRAGSRAKAYPVDRVVRERTVHDQLGDLELVLVGDPESGAVRAWRRTGQRFSLEENGRGLRDETGRRWQITEEALIAATAPGEAAQRLERLPGHVSFWFGWFGFFPETEVYGGAPTPPSSPPPPAPP